MSATRPDNTKINNGIATFYVHYSVEELAKQQGVEPVTDVRKLAGDFWPEDEDPEEFIETLARWRKEGDWSSKENS